MGARIEGKFCAHFLGKQGAVACVVQSENRFFQRGPQKINKCWPGREKSSFILPSGLLWDF